MSRAFVKENDLEHTGTDLPERPVSSAPNYVTPAGLELLQQQLLALEHQRESLQLRKEDPVARQRLGMLERDLRYVQARLESAELVDGSKQPQDIVVFGCTVSMEDENGDTHVFTIVGEDEADIAQGKVSWVSPLAHALLGNKPGDSVVWPRPAGNLVLEITQIRN